MKVMLVNGSPHEHGCTARALEEIKKTLVEEGIEVGEYWIGKGPIQGCIGCHYCGEHDGKCVFNDQVNEFNEKAAEYDGFFFGAPVYYASMAGSMRAFLDRVFFSSAHGSTDVYRLKPVAGVSAARRGGQTSAWDQFNKYFGILEMPIITSVYWNMVFGLTPEQVEEDAEGLRTMRVLGHNMAYELRCQEAARAAGVKLPPVEPMARTNFVRSNDKL